MATMIRHAVVKSRSPEVLSSRPVATASLAHAGVRLVRRAILPVQITACFLQTFLSLSFSQLNAFPP